MEKHHGIKREKCKVGKNSNLSLKGIENAKKLGEHLKDIRFDAVYCSSLGRAQETAAHIIGDKPLVITYCDDLKEMNFGTHPLLKI